MHQIINNTSREEWLNARKHDVTASEVAALFGISPYMSKYELW
ncbi:endonuclease, partial [bacterium]|nr:endonuclease [bacterium]